MDDVLVRIKRAVLAGRYLFSEKASCELEADGLTELDVAEAILNAVAIYIDHPLAQSAPRPARREALHHRRYHAHRVAALYQGEVPCR
jgi:hypothetical protein